MVITLLHIVISIAGNINIIHNEKQVTKENFEIERNAQQKTDKTKSRPRPRTPNFSGNMFRILCLKYYVVYNLRQ